MDLKFIEKISKKIIAIKELVTIIRVTIGDYLAAWFAVKFISRDLNFKKCAHIVYGHKFIKVPKLEQSLIE
jgi:hypothetical protein